ncbi:hypothetical protein B0H15DRAFT_309590 [Mycena belliarum]|uniref:Transmembrane protein n=1 Tax=Mycena belliarum TaxID=1033014 RepID=A0AAD6U7J9_9AGAR|nr:hypothetical protein B0H15DRAFT_309590 [Mycena belliae]
MFSSSPAARISLFAAFLLFLSSVVYLLTPSHIPFGPVTLEEYFAEMLHASFAEERVFEQLEAMYAPMKLVMRFPDRDIEPDAPVYIDVLPPQFEFDDVPTRVDASPDTSFPDNMLVAPLPDAPLSSSPLPSFMAAVILTFTVVALVVVVAATGTLFIKRASASQTRGLAQTDTRRVPPARRPRHRSSGETSRDRVSHMRRSEKFRPSLSSIGESPWTNYTFDGAGFLQALEALACVQREAKRQKAEQSFGATSFIDERPVRVHPKPRCASAEEPEEHPATIEMQPRTRTQTASDHVSGSLTRAGAAVQRVIPPSPLRLPPVARGPASSRPDRSTESPVGTPLVPLATHRAPPLMTFVPGEILYQTPTSASHDPSFKHHAPPAPPVAQRIPPPTMPFTQGDILYQTSAPATRTSSMMYHLSGPVALGPISSLIYSTSGSTTVPTTRPEADSFCRHVQRTSGIVFLGRSAPPRQYQHSPIAWPQLQSQTTSHPVRRGRGNPSNSSTSAYNKRTNLFSEPSRHQTLRHQRSTAAKPTHYLCTARREVRALEGTCLCDGLT